MQRYRQAIHAAKWGVCLLALLYAAGSLPALGQGSSGKTVAYVNGEAISEAEFIDRLKRMTAQDFIASENPLTFQNNTAGQILMATMITERLTLQLAKKNNALPSDAEVNAECERRRQQPATHNALTQRLLTEETFRHIVRVYLARIRLATAGITLSPAEVENYYKANLARYTTPEQVGLAVIRTTDSGAVPKIQEELKAGKSFSEVSRTYTDDKQLAQRGGDLGVVSIRTLQEPAALFEAVKALKVGQVSPPVPVEMKTPAGKRVMTYWFVRLNSRQPEIVLPFVDVKPDVERAALLDRAGGIQVADRKIEQFWNESDIQILLPGYQNLTRITPGSTTRP